MERRYKHSGSTARAEYISPCSLVQVIVYVINVTATNQSSFYYNHPILIIKEREIIKREIKETWHKQ